MHSQVLIRDMERQDIQRTHRGPRGATVIACDPAAPWLRPATWAVAIAACAACWAAVAYGAASLLGG